jgi:SAM-dependent methyltransferase
MESYNEATYGERIAGVYDELYGTYDESVIATLADLAHGGRALELGIGTGRIALPLQQRGVQVSGVDASPAMVERLRAKPGGQSIPVAFGDFADVPVPGEFSLIFVVFNTFYALLTQEKQIQCLTNVAQHLTAEGVFVIEAFVPDMARYRARQNMQVIGISENEVRFDAAQVDPVNQVIFSQHVHLNEAGVRLYPVKLRYVWPSELDLMARLAGLRLQQRWSNWQGAAFTADAGKHVSVFGLATA